MHQVEESTRGRWQLDRVCTEAAGDASQACIRCWRVGLPPCSHLQCIGRRAHSPETYPQVGGPPSG